MVTTRRPGPTLPWRRRPPATWRVDGGSGDERVIDEVVLLALGPHELLDADVEPAGHQHRHLLLVAPASVGAGWRDACSTASRDETKTSELCNRLIF
jgi:hypothetical protein